MNQIALQEWLSLPPETRKAAFAEAAARLGLPAAAIEKDWWVVRTLEQVFATSIAGHTVFKGGTSLSKAWGLIDRFSEDIDLALDRALLGITKPDEEMTGSQVSKLRKASAEFISGQFFPELSSQFQNSGLEVNIHPAEVKTNDQDPIILEVYYPSLTENTPYLQPRVLIEIGSRSLMEPLEYRRIASMMGEAFQGQPFADLPIVIPTVQPQRTFLEKIFLLHEEFQQAPEKIKTERKTRHWYDLEKLMNTPFAQQAMADKKLYQTIVLHRQKLNTIRGINYALHKPEHIRIMPPDAIQDKWQKDYDAMRESMIYGEALRYEALMQRMQELNRQINHLKLTE